MYMCIVVLVCIGMICLAGIDIYRHRKDLKYLLPRYKDIYNIDGSLYYKVGVKDRGMYMIKNSEGDTLYQAVSADQHTYCPKCVFFSCPGISHKCMFIDIHKKCPLRGKGYFIEIGDGI